MANYDLKTRVLTELARFFDIKTSSNDWILIKEHTKNDRPTKAINFVLEIYKDFTNEANNCFIGKFLAQYGIKYPTSPLKPSSCVTPVREKTYNKMPLLEPIGDKEIAYLESRGFDGSFILKNADYFKSVTDPHNKYYNRLAIMNYDSDGSVKYIMFRAMSKAADLRYLYLEIKDMISESLFNFSNVEENCEVLYIFEGALDCLRFGEPNCVATGGAGISKQQAKLVLSKNPQKIVKVCDRGFFDKDVEVFKARGLNLYNVFVVQPFYEGTQKDICDLLQTQINVLKDQRSWKPIRTTLLTNKIVNYSKFLNDIHIKNNFNFDLF